MTTGIAAVESRIAAIQARFAFTDRWVFDPEPEAPYRTGGLYLGSSVADVAAPAGADDVFAPDAVDGNDVAASGVAQADLADPATAAAQQRLLGRTYGVQASTLRPDDGAWIRRLPEAGVPWAGAVADAARANGLEPELLAAVAWTESGFDAAATSPGGGQGLLQLGPDTAQRLGVDAGLPLDNLSGGARELRRLLDAAGGRVPEAVAAFHSGTAVGLGRRDAWSPATTAYVDTVLERRATVLGERADPSARPEADADERPPAPPSQAPSAARRVAPGWMAR